MNGTASAGLLNEMVIAGADTGLRADYILLIISGSLSLKCFGAGGRKDLVMLSDKPHPNQGWSAAKVVD